MIKIKFIRNEYIFKDSSRYIGKRLINQRHLLEQEMLLSTIIKLDNDTPVIKDENKIVISDDLEKEINEILNERE